MLASMMRKFGVFSEGSSSSRANVWEVRPEGKAGFTSRTIDPKPFRRAHRSTNPPIAADVRRLTLAFGKAVGSA
jgi:hypothetical protein